MSPQNTSPVEEAFGTKLKELLAEFPTIALEVVPNYTILIKEKPAAAKPEAEVVAEVPAEAVAADAVPVEPEAK
jgi:hypothetical protein